MIVAVARGARAAAPPPLRKRASAPRCGGPPYGRSVTRGRQGGRESEPGALVVALSGYEAQVEARLAAPPAWRQTAGELGAGEG